MRDRTIQLDCCVIEITRRCNMACAHCMRGDAQNLDIDSVYIDRYLSHVSSIYDLTFTGGEPCLNLPAVRHTLEYCKANHVTVTNFNIITNGKELPDEFIPLCLDWLDYCLQCCGAIVYDENDSFSSISISSDNFHEPIPEENRRRLSALRIYHDKLKTTDFTRPRTLINLGRARELDDYEKREPSRYRSGLPVDSYDWGYGVEESALTATGHIVPYCDYEYEETEDIAVCHLDDNLSFLNHLRDICTENMAESA